MTATRARTNFLRRNAICATVLRLEMRGAYSTSKPSPEETLQGVGRRVVFKELWWRRGMRVSMGRRIFWVWACSIVLLLGAALAQAQQKDAPLLVVISIDGLRPDYVTAADAHGAKVPNLRRFMKEGTYADGVTGVVPTVTYPSHTTLVTGVWPATHGILANTTFDPLQKNYQGWYWYAEDIRVPTLWDAAGQAGRSTASVQWPVTVGAKITWDIPEVWRA